MSTRFMHLDDGTVLELSTKPHDPEMFAEAEKMAINLRSVIRCGVGILRTVNEIEVVPASRIVRVVYFEETDGEVT